MKLSRLTEDSIFKIDDWRLKIGHRFAQIHTDIHDVGNFFAIVVKNQCNPCSSVSHYKIIKYRRGNLWEK